MTNVVLKPSDRELIYELAHKLTGTAEDQSMQHEVFITNVQRRINQVGKLDLISYLDYVSKSEVELAHFISAVTIHTTGWFRELPHYKNIERLLLTHQTRLKSKRVRLLSAACSSGEELYSLGMILETLRRAYPGFEYELCGFDIDPICIQKAETGFYQNFDMHSIPPAYQHFLVKAKQSPESYAIDPDIRSRSFFHVGNLLDAESFLNDPFDFVLCRNVLIYFSREKVNSIVGNLLGVLKSDGSLTLGHSEAIDGKRFNLMTHGESTYSRADESKTMPFRERPITVLAVDNTKVRLWLATVLADHGIKVITAETTDAASEILTRNKVDLVTLDLNLPGQNGVAWLSALRRDGFKIPVMLLTETSAEQVPNVLDALSGGSQDFVDKRQLEHNSVDFIERIRDLVKAYRQKADEEQRPVTFAEFKGNVQHQLFRPEVMLFGASTGGTEALCQLLRKMPKDAPPIVCVQHIPHQFANAFLERLARSSGLKAATPEADPILKPGTVYLSTIDAHIGVRGSGTDRNGELMAYYSHSEKITGHRPSVDYLFQTASFLRRRRILGCLLTGMGRDGANGLLELKRNGALTLAQNQESSVVWGMPGEAVKLGAPTVVGALPELREVILQCLSLAPEKRGSRTGS